MSNRINFGKLKDIIPFSNLIENQIKSFMNFLQFNKKSHERENTGLEEILKETFTIEGHENSNCTIEYVSYRLLQSKLDPLKCIENGQTYSFSLYITLKLKTKNVTKEEEIYMGEFPMITNQGSFIINGAERVVVSQLHRSPGVFFDENINTNGKKYYSFKIIPDRGTWLEVQCDNNNLLYVYLDRKRKKRKFLLSTLIRAFGYSEDLDIIKLFYSINSINIQNIDSLQDLSNLILIEDIIDTENGIIIARSFEHINQTIINNLKKTNIQHLNVINIKNDDGAIINTLKRDNTKNDVEAMKDIFKRLKPGEPINEITAKSFINKLFHDYKRYSLGDVGRFKLNQKLKLNISLNHKTLHIEDIINSVKYLSKIKQGEKYIDDVDHLGNRRVKTVGELLANQCRLGLSRTERFVKEKIALYDQSLEAITPQKLINNKSLSTVIRDFFARSQLSQFMDQINPLSELTHKRRISALGPGGLNRERAGFEVRDVHTSHYGRICPIETPEGPNIGLINSLSTYAKINKFGFIETPYRKVINGRITNQVQYLSADEETGYVIAQANSEFNEDGFLNGLIIARKDQSVYEASPQEIDYIDVSPKQVVSVAAGMIPFLEHDDANRALMGSNMQRQGVPLLKTEAPFVGTGLEKRVAEDSLTVILSKTNGVVKYVDYKKIIIVNDNNEEDCYFLKKFMRSNAGTCFNQKPIVKKNEKITKGQVIADGSATDNGELALGRNILVSFMPWNGYNFEDAIIISEKLIKDDVYTSIHIEAFETSAIETKLGPEEITKDIPNISEENLMNLDRNGIVKIGAEIRPGDILVGKITPKSETELSPEEKLLRAIFGEKAADVKDTSLIVPSGVNGIVMDIKITSRLEQDQVTSSDKKRQIKKINEEYKSQYEKIKDELTESLSNILLGEKIPLDVINKKTKEIVIPANRKITKTLLRRFASVSKDVFIDTSPVKIKIMDIVTQFHKKFDDLEIEKKQKIITIESGKTLSSGVIKNVKVYIAVKRKIQVGDKMAGRHGNKGVVSKIVPIEDMPYLEDGTPIDMILNPLGVPSRMNLGQVLETHLGWVCKKLNIKIATPIFDGISEEKIRNYLKKANLPESGKVTLYDGRTGEKFNQKIVVGYIYMMKLNHLVANKIHARSVGPYSLITQQPLGGKAQYGGQRFGEMEVWALEAYGAAYTLQELLTVKSDDVSGRTKMYESLVKGENSLITGTPQSFNVLLKEMQSLCLDIKLGKEKEEEESNLNIKK